MAEAQNKTAERQRILEEVCEHAPASATEVAALKDLSARVGVFWSQRVIREP